MSGLENEFHDPATCPFCAGIVSLREERERREKKRTRRRNALCWTTILFGTFSFVFNGFRAVTTTDNINLSFFHMFVACGSLLVAAFTADVLVERSLKEKRVP